MDKSTGILTASEIKFKKEECTTNSHAQHTIKLCIYLDKHCVITSIFPTPVWVGMDTFSIHSTSTAKITLENRT